MLKDPARCGSVGLFEWFVEADLRRLPRPLDVVLYAGETRNAVAEQLVRHEQHPADRRCADNQRRQRQVVADRQGDQQLGVDLVTRHIQPAIQLEVGRRTTDGDGLAGVKHTLLGQQPPIQPVVTEPLAEQIGEIQPQAAPYRIEVEHAEHAQRLEIGRASCRERVYQYVEILVVAVSLKKKTQKHNKSKAK